MIYLQGLAPTTKLGLECSKWGGKEATYCSMEERTMAGDVMEGSDETDQTSDEKLVPASIESSLCRKGVFWWGWNGHSAGSGEHQRDLAESLARISGMFGGSISDGRRMQMADVQCQYWICSPTEEEVDVFQAQRTRVHPRHIDSSTFLHCRVDSIMSPAQDHDQVGTATVTLDEEATNLRPRRQLPRLLPLGNRRQCRPPYLSPARPLLPAKTPTANPAHGAANHDCPKGISAPKNPVVSIRS